MDPFPVGAAGEGALVAAEAGAALVRTGGGGLWFRAAGGAWTDVGGDRNVFPGPGRTSSLGPMAPAVDTLVALGYDGGDPARWTSSNGRGWTAAKPFEAGNVVAVAAFGNDLVAVGTTRPAANEGNVAAVWVSADNGVTWEVVGAGNPAFRVESTTQMFGVTVAGVGLVAVGLSYDGVDIDAHAWFSATGGHGAAPPILRHGLPRATSNYIRRARCPAEGSSPSAPSSSGGNRMRGPGSRSTAGPGSGPMAPELRCSPEPASTISAGARRRPGQCWWPAR